MESFGVRAARNILEWYDAELVFMTNRSTALHLSRPVNANRRFVEFWKSDTPDRTDQTGSCTRV